MKKLTAATLLAIMFQACATAPSQPTPPVRLVSDTPTGCKYIGAIQSYGGNVFSVQGEALAAARKQMKFAAHKMGANTVEITPAGGGQGGSQALDGEAYFCE